MFDEHAVVNSDIIGIGQNVVKFTRKDTTDVVCYMSTLNNEDVVFFNKPTSIDSVITIANLLQKKKLQKALKEKNYSKIQKIANKMFE